jgi:hypothetical protein
MSFNSASQSLVPIETGASDCETGVVLIEAIGTAERMGTLGARKGARNGSLLIKHGRRDRRQRILRRVELRVLNPENIADQSAGRVCKAMRWGY